MTQKKKPNKKKNRKESNHSSIKEHKVVGKDLVPPLLSMGVPGLTLTSWMNDRLPEMLWGALLVSELPRQRALQALWKVAEAATALRDDSDSAPDVGSTHSALPALPGDLFRQITELLCSDEARRLALRPLLLLPSLPGYDTWKAVIREEAKDEDWETLGKAVLETLDHQSQASTDCRWGKIMFLGAAGRIHVAPTMSDVIETLERYPRLNEEELRSARPLVRSMEGAFQDISGLKSAWSKEFWQFCLENTGCKGAQEQSPEEPDRQSLLERYSAVYEALMEHQIKTLTTTEVDAKHDLVFGMPLFAMSMLMEVLHHSAGTAILARMALRSIVEMYLTLAYLQKLDQADLWESYRIFGAGQAKLAFLKLEEAEDLPSFVDVKTLQRLANEDKWQEFTPINLSHWEKSNLRSISEKSGLKDVYDRYYSWTSTYLHGHWGAIRDSVFQTCLNPLHRLHRIARHSPRPLEDAVTDAVDLVDAMLVIVDQAYPTFPHRLSDPKGPATSTDS